MFDRYTGAETKETGKLLLSGLSGESPALLFADIRRNSQKFVSAGLNVRSEQRKELPEMEDTNVTQLKRGGVNNPFQTICQQEILY